MDPEGLEVSEVCFHKKIAENRTIQSSHRTENIILNLISIYGQSCSFKSLERVRDSVNESRKFFLDWEASQPRPSQKLQELRASQQSDAQNCSNSNSLLIEDTNNSNVASIQPIAQRFKGSGVPREGCVGAHVATQVHCGENISEFDCDLKREMERVKRKKNCANFSSQKFSRFHADVDAPATAKVHSGHPSNAGASDTPLLEKLTRKSAMQAKKCSGMSVKERLMNDNGKIFKIPRREVKPSANKAKLNDWLAQNKKQSIKRKLREDQNEFKTHINSKRMKITQIDPNESCAQLKQTLTTQLNSKHVLKHSLIPRPIHSTKANLNKETSLTVAKQTGVNDVKVTQPESIKPLSATGAQATVHKSFIPRLVKVTKQSPGNAVNHIPNANNKPAKINNLKPTSLNRKPTAVNSRVYPPTYSVTQKFHDCFKQINTCAKDPSKTNVKYQHKKLINSHKHTSLKVNKLSAVNIVKPIPR